MKKVGIVACSDALKKEKSKQIDELTEFLTSSGMNPVMSSCIYEKEDSIFSGSPKEKASQLMKMFADPDIEEIYDVSGGNLANQILEYIDYELISKSKATFWGYSDLSTIINAIYTMTGKASVLYQVKFMTSFGDSSRLQRERFLNRDKLFLPRFEFVRNNTMNGIVVGGNIRCFLKLSGTKYFPDLHNKILLLESLGGEVHQMATYLAWLKQLGAFDKLSGIILGTFTAMEENNCIPDIVTMVKEYAQPQTPIAVTTDIGHRDDAKAIYIGNEIHI